MAKFEVKVVKINDVKDHPNADRLSLIQIGGYNVVSAKKDDGSHRYQIGDLVIYVPENALVPEYLLKRGFWDEKKGIGFLAGPLGNRVKPVTLRGILSEGIIFPTIMMYNTDGSCKECAVVGDNDQMMVVSEGTDVAEFLNIVKWEPEVPTNMAGDVLGYIGPIKYDIENIKKYNQVFVEGEMVYMTEKLHGTQVQFGWMIGENDEKLFEGQFFASSKGMASQNVIFKDTETNREKNLYVRTLIQNIENFRKLETYFSKDEKVIFFGEIIGKGVQDLNYNVEKGTFRVFDIWVDGKFLDYSELTKVTEAADLETVPVVYIGPFSQEALEQNTKGLTFINKAHIREGVVIKPLIERVSEWIGRVILKSVSEDYLKRKNGTEYN